MNKQEFQNRRNKLGEVIASGLMYYAIWQKIVYRDPKTATWSLDQLNAMLGRFRGFFSPVALTLINAAYLQFTTVFDDNPQTVSLRVLVNAAKGNTSLVPGATVQGLKKIEQELAQHDDLVKRLKKRRNQYIAHVDANPQELTPEKKKEFDALIGSVEAAFIDLSVAHDGLSYQFDSLIVKAEQVTVDAIGGLIELTDKS